MSTPGSCVTGLEFCVALVAIECANTAAATDASTPAFTNSLRLNFPGMQVLLLCSACLQAGIRLPRVSPEGQRDTLQHLPHDVWQDAAVAEVVDFLWSIGAGDSLKHFFLAVFVTRANLDRQTGSEFRDAIDREFLKCREAECLYGFTSAILQREHTHSQQVAAVDAFVAFRNH